MAQLAKRISGRWAPVLAVAVIFTGTATTVTAATTGGGSRTRVLAGLNRPGLAAKDNRRNYFGPNPDTTGAIGPRHYFEVVKSRLALFNRANLRPVAVADAYAFWGKPLTAGFLTDPNVVWDRSAHRWYYVGALTASNNQLLLAWSKRGDPNNLSSDWCRISISTGPVFDDFPHIAYSNNSIVIATNAFDLQSGKFLTSRVVVIAKPRGTTCRRPAIHIFGSPSSPLRRADGRIAVTLIPVNPVRPSNSAYVVSSDCLSGDKAGEEEATCGPDNNPRITVWKVLGPGRSPRLVRIGGIRVPAYHLPKPVALPHSRSTLDSSDTRLTQAVSAPDPTLGVPVAIWTQHAVAGPGGRSVVRWYELDPRRLVVLRHGVIASNGNWVFNAAISPTSRGNAATISYDVAGTSLLPVIRARSRGPRTPRNQMTSEVTLARSGAPETCKPDPGETCQWGDYAAATPDPRRPGVVWGSNQVLGAATHAEPWHWRTQNFALTP
jgi:hypothetical protein